MLVEQKEALLARLVADRAQELAKYADPDTAVAGAIKFAPMLDDMVATDEEPADAAHQASVLAQAMALARRHHETVIARLREHLAALRYAGMSDEQACAALLERERVTVPGVTAMAQIVADVLSRLPARPADLLVTSDGQASVPLVQQMIDDAVAASGKTRDELLVREDTYQENGPVPWAVIVDGVPYGRNVPKIDLIREARDGR